MTEKRIKFSNIIQNQLPAYVREEFPLVVDFLNQYYISQEFQSAPSDIIQNIDQYLKLDTIKNNSESTTLTSDISFLDETIPVTSTIGFLDSYGLLLIDDEVITYTGRTSTSFTGCIRGFSGTTSYDNENNPDELVFVSSESADHTSVNDDGSAKEVINLSSLFLKEFFNKIKYQLTPGFEDREFYTGLDKYLFLKQSKDFYSTRGTDLSYRILFKALYGEDVRIVKPKDYLIKPSGSQYNISNNLIVEGIEGDPTNLERSTLFQDAYDYANITKGYVPISEVEKIFTETEKVYYKLSFDSGYNRDINVDGSLYGNFKIHPRTKVIGNVYSTSNTIDVDSTVGFPSAGELHVVYSDGSSGVIYYSSKNLNQFFGCTNIVGNIEDSSDISLNVYAYGESNDNSGNIIKVRITAVLENVNIPKETYYYNKGDTGIIKTLGINADDLRSNNWFFNISFTCDVSSINVLNDVDKIYEVETKTNHGLRIGDNVTLISSDGVSADGSVLDVSSSSIVKVGTESNIILQPVKTFIIKRNLSKVNYDALLNQNANIQNVYKEIDSDKILVSSASLPFYAKQPLDVSDRRLEFKGTFVNVDIPENPGYTDTIIISPSEHGYYTGDAVYYTPSSETDSLFEEGFYYVQRVNQNTLKFAKSRSNLYNSIFVPFKNPVTLSEDSLLEPFDFKSQNLQSQKILREISDPENDGNEYVTSPGTTGILINGVEILNYKSNDRIYYGSIENIEITGGGSGYDVINPPNLVIEDEVGTGATGYCSVKGSLQEIRIIDPGFDYIQTPQVNINGGNGTGAKAKSSLKQINYQISFNSEGSSNFVSIQNNTIGFSTYHKLRNAERIVYKTDSQKAVGGISTNSTYYVSVKDPYTIQFHKYYDEAVSGINTISLTEYGVGNHFIQSYNKKNILSSINIEDGGSGYENKKRTVSSSGISTSSNSINIKNHNFESGEIIKYYTSGTVIGGLTNNEKYYITKIDENRFRLSTIANIEGYDKDFYYKTKQYIQFTSLGSGVHVFNYPEITVDIIGNTGVGSSTISFAAVVQPIFRGEITSVHLEQNGVGYGSSEVLNFNREPSLTLDSGSKGEVIPIINNGKIVDILIKNSGKGYISPPDLSIVGNTTGIGAVLTPVIENGEIKSVNIIESGAGYDQNNTSIIISSSGSGAKFKPNLKTWTVNNVERYLTSISLDDGFLYKNPNSKYGLQYTHLYAPRKLRESLYSIETGGSILYGKKDLEKGANNTEILSNKHSPIIGWAYDGNPIYGPYGYSKKDGGTIKKMSSGYSKIEQSLQGDRPPFPSGFFVEDYEYRSVDDDSVLDEYNGRFCITPDFPNGTYAYFATIDNTPNQTSFNGYILPTFPYLIGNKFKSKPNIFNFKIGSNQDDIDLNQSNWLRNTNSFNLLKQHSTYPYIALPNRLNQTVDVKYSSPGSVEKVKIVSGGDGYKVNDSIVFTDKNTGGFGFSSKVSKIEGKSITNISVATTTFYNSKIYPDQKNRGFFIVETNSPHNFSNNDIISISGLSTTTSRIEGSYSIGVSANTLAISDPSGIGNSASTGIITYFSVSGNLSNSSIKENDIFIIGEEKIKVLNIDYKSSRIRVLRSVDGTIGLAHSYSDILYELPNRFSLKIENYEPNIRELNVNREIYFNPKDSLGVGTNFGVGIGTTISFSNPGVGITQIFIPTKSIYLPNHNLNTGDLVTYTTIPGNGIVVSYGSSTFALQNQTNLYVAKISNDLIGISTVKVGLGSTGTFVGIASTTVSFSTLYLVGFGSGGYHSFKTNYESLSGQISRNIVTVSTAQTHGLLDNDEVFVKVNPGISTTYTIKYDDYNRKILVNPRSFSSGNVNIAENKITILNHNFDLGEKIVHTSTSPCGGLINNKIYYIINYDKDTIKLSSTYYNSLRYISDIDITSSSFGTLSSVNPPIKVYKDSLINFDLSDSSLSYLDGPTRYSAFDFDFYIDENFKEIFDTSKTNQFFEVSKIGQIGISSNAKVSLTVNENIPKKLYYTLKPLYGRFLPTEKKQIDIDSSVFSNNQIQVVDSVLNGKHNVISTSSTHFTYNVSNVPEKLFYDGSSSTLEYQTNSKNTRGPISEVRITSRGTNYYTLPDFSNVISDDGNKAILEAESKSIGSIKKTKISNIGFDFPSDLTLKPSLSFPQILKIEPLNSIDSIGITSVGRGYISSPKLLIFDGKTGDLLPEVDLFYSLTDNEVTILSNTFRLNDVEPNILPVQNSNGVGINSISYNSITNTVTAVLSVGFSTENTFPFKDGDKILVENVNITEESAGKGYNSENYNYALFNIVGVDTNIGGNGSITYSLDNLLGFGEVPGTYDPTNSSGRIIPEKYFPKFKTKIKTNRFFEGENVRYSDQNTTIGFIENWNEDIKYLKVSSRESIKSGNVLEGVSSKTRGVISEVIDFDSFINLGPYSKIENGWSDTSGFLNDNLQRIQDNFYYQNFSYSLRSRVPYDTWENAVSSLNHTAGFKKFSDYQLESKQYCGVNTESISITDSFTDIIGVANLNTFHDFDLARENAISFESGTLSDEINFKSRILMDYYESVGNRVLTIDNFSEYFDSNPRQTRYSVVNRFLLQDFRALKYITCVKDRRFADVKQVSLLTLLHNNNNGYLNQYGRVETHYDLGTFDFSSNGYEGSILFYPTSYSSNNYNVATLSYNLKDNFAGIGTTSIGDIVKIEKNTVFVSTGSTTIVSLATTQSSAKILVEITGDNGEYQFDEINLISNGTDVEMIDYGNLSSSPSGLGTYYPYIDAGPVTNIDFIPSVGIAASISTIVVSFSDPFSSFGPTTSFDMEHARIESRTTGVAASSTPTPQVISEFSDDYDCGYFLVQMYDVSNSNVHLSEVIVVSNDNDSYSVEYANLEFYPNIGVGSITTLKTPNSTQLLFTAVPDISFDVKVYANFITFSEDTNLPGDFYEKTLLTDYGVYYGTDTYPNNYFDLRHKKYPIFKKYFDASNPLVVNLQSNTIDIENHFFVTGEKVSYSSSSENDIFEINSPIGITTTDFGVGIGTTDKLPSTVYVVKIDENKIKLASSAENALKTLPTTLTFTSVGIGSTHNLTSFNRNERSLITIDNVLQSPIVSTSTTTKLSKKLTKFEDVLFVDSNTDFFAGDLIKIEDEIVKIQSVGVDSSNSIEVLRSWMGTNLVGHSTDTQITKISGNYNISGNKIIFDSPPYGNVPISSTTNIPSEVDWDDISTRSSFQGRVFLRTAIKDSSNDPYSENYIFDDVSNLFDGYQDTFSLKKDGNDITGFYDKNAIVSINNIFQYPGAGNNYTLSESTETLITFTGNGVSVPSDINTSDLPRGKIIYSVGSTEGFGYQPLISAGGTAIVSASGTISSVSIGNSGSGYRNYIQTLGGIVQNVVRVGVATSSTGIPSIHFIGTAIVTNGNVVSIAITNPGVGYTYTKPPYVLIDDPLSYSDIPLVYSSTSSGIGTYATADIVVGQNSKVIDFTLKNNGYGYNVGDILTVPTGGISGIPTNSNTTIQEFQISIQKTFSDKFSSWFVGELQSLDDISYLFNGKKVIFPLSYQSEVRSLYPAKGSLVDIQNVLLVFLNDVLQVPGEGYIFNGGSVIEFTEPPKSGDICRILFYKGSGDDIDVIFKNTIETVKAGDDLQLSYDISLGQSPALLEDSRTSTLVKSADIVTTNPYFGPGNTTLQTLFRPISWTKQGYDKIIDEKEVSKDRVLYEPSIYPYAYAIQPIGIGSTIIFVDNLRPFFNPANESGSSLQFQKKVTIIPQESKVSASATAVVSVAGTISSVVINDGGVGYSSAPKVTIQKPSGIGATLSTLTATSSITSGSVTSISLSGVATGYSRTSPPVVLIEPPTFDLEENLVKTYSGDSGFISGISTTTIGIGSTGITFDLVIPRDSYIRNSSVMGLGATTISGIQTGYYFVVSKSNVGKGLTSLNQSGSVVGVGTSFIDGVYAVHSVSIAQTTVVGLGVTYVAKVTVRVSGYNGLNGIGYSGYYGDYSWGRILLESRSGINSYTSYTTNGYSGISTGTLITRANPLKYLYYIS